MWTLEEFLVVKYLQYCQIKRKRTNWLSPEVRIRGRVGLHVKDFFSDNVNDLQ